MVTTLFDRYALPQDWPGLDKSRRVSDLGQAHRILGEAMRDRIYNAMGSDFNQRRFLPYIQFYEIEAFLFAEPETTARMLGNSACATQLREVVQEGGGCEHINDDPSRAPSKRIQKLFPSYIKGQSPNAHLVRVCGEIGLDALCTACHCSGTG
ncbi:DUF4276 family protein [Candidatus Nitrospira bockiana]